MRFSLQNNTSYSNINVLYNISESSNPSLFSNRTTHYSYGFNGKEKDDELFGSNNSYDYSSRMYDPRLGRWLSLDPQSRKFASLSPYSSFNNCPVLIIDPSGKGGELGNIRKENGQYRADLVFTINLVVDGSAVSMDAVKLATASYMEKETTVGKGVIGGTVGKNKDAIMIYTDVKIKVNIITKEDAEAQIISETNKSNNYIYVIDPADGTTGEKNFYGSNQGVITMSALKESAAMKFITHYAWHSAGAQYGKEDYGVGSHNSEESGSIMYGSGEALRVNGEILQSDFDALSPIFEQKNHTRMGSGVPIHINAEKDATGKFKTYQFGVGINNKVYSTEDAINLWKSPEAETEVKEDVNIDKPQE